MDKDIVPELLANIEQEFDLRTFDSLKLKTAIRQLRDKTATYRDVNEFAIEVGEILASTLKGHVTADTLPDGKMYYNIAERILNPTMQKNYDLISNFAADVQTELNHKAGLHLKGQKSLLNKDRINGIANRVSNEGDFSKIKWILDEPIVNFSQSIVDDAIKANADFHLKAGLSPSIERIATGQPCDWCKAVEGSYDYPDVPKDVFRRHRYCRCNVDYDPKTGRRQNVWSKRWKEQERYDKIEARKSIGLKEEREFVKGLEQLKKSGMTEREYAEYLSIINKNDNLAVRKLYSKYGDEIAGVTFSNSGVYSPFHNTLKFSYPMYRDINKYGTLAHEYGHFFDSKVSFKGLHFKEMEAVRKATELSTTFQSVASSSDEFLAAIRKDKVFIKSIFTDEIKKDFLAHNASHGVQDAIDGLFPKSRIAWGHGEKYYNQKYLSVESMNEFYPATKNLQEAYKALGLDASDQAETKLICRQYEAASEAWANIMSAEVCGGEELEYVKKYLPNSYEAMLEILKGVK